VYIPASFAETDLGTLHDFITAHSFATLVSAAADPPGHSPDLIASHLPLLCHRETGSHGQLVGHLAAANPHWQRLEGSNVLSIFSGPHAYISPTWFEPAAAVPTWNYVAVHVYGRVRIERNPQRLAEIVAAFVEFYEAAMPSPWKLEALDPDFLAKLLDAIVGFTIDIERLEGKWKLSQNHTVERRESAIKGLKSLGGENRERTAEWMAATIDT